MLYDKLIISRDFKMPGAFPYKEQEELIGHTPEVQPHT